MHAQEGTRIPSHSDSPDLTERKDECGVGLPQCPSIEMDTSPLSQPHGSRSFVESTKRKAMLSPNGGPSKRRQTSPESLTKEDIIIVSQPASPCVIHTMSLRDTNVPLRILSFSSSRVIEERSREIVAEKRPQLHLVPLTSRPNQRASRRQRSRPHPTPQSDPTELDAQSGSSIENMITDTRHVRGSSDEGAVMPGRTASILHSVEWVAIHLSRSTRCLNVTHSVAPVAKPQLLRKTAITTVQQGSIAPAHTTSSSEAALEAPVAHLEKPSKPPSVPAINRDVKQPFRAISGAKKSTKEKPAKVTPAEYAQRLREAGPPQRSTSATRFLEGYRILYTGGDSNYASETTRRRMDLVCRLPLFVEPC